VVDRRVEQIDADAFPRVYVKGTPIAVPQGAAVADDYQSLPAVSTGDLFYALSDSGEPLADTLAPRNRPIDDALAVNSERLRLFLQRSRYAHARQDAQVPFAQALIELDRQSADVGDGLGRLPRAHKVAAVDGGERAAGKTLRERVGLAQTACVQRNLQVPLDAPLGIPVRLTVADEQDAGGHARARAVSSAFLMSLLAMGAPGANLTKDAQYIALEFEWGIPPR